MCVNLEPDKESYDDIWEKLIKPQLDKYKEVLGECVSIDNNIKDLIWKEYVVLNRHCKTEYMVDPNGRLDRHKVAACYLIAILHVNPIRFVSVPLDDDRYFVINAKIAIATAMSIVRAYVLASCDGLSGAEKNNIKKKFEDGLSCPPDEFVHHGDYLKNFASEIYYVNRDGKLHVLPIAHELYLLEVLTHVLS